jgi:hypothetical protein
VGMGIYLPAIIIRHFVQSNFAQPGEIAAFMTEGAIRFESGDKSVLDHLFGKIEISPASFENKPQDFGT